MSASQKKEKKRYGWPVILIVILILLAIKYGNEKNIGSDPLAGEQEDTINHAVLSAVPEELHGNFFLQQKENGCCKSLTGSVAISVVMVSDSVSQWDEEAATNLKASLMTYTQDIINDAKAYETALSFRLNYYSVRVAEDLTNVGAEANWQDTVLEKAGLPPLDELHSSQTEKYFTKEAPVVFAFNRTGRSYASCGKNDFVVLYNKDNFDAFQHELSHVFGAKDFYYPESVKSVAETYLPNSIMCTGEEVDPLTAYLIGWTDTLTDDVLQFLRQTNDCSQEYMDEEREKEQFTGYGTKKYENGIYTGDLVKGWCHGNGTMLYNDGGWYRGQWENNKMVESGSGKMIYDNGYYEGEFYNGKRHGQGTYVWTNGATYTGGWKDGEKSGKGSGKIIYDNGYYEGEFYNGQRHGQGTYVWSNGKSKTGTWKNGEFYG